MPEHKLTNYELLREMLKTIPEGDACLLWPRPGVNKCQQIRVPGKDRLGVVHRIAYEKTIGEIPEGLCVIHKCREHSCFRPSHLFLGIENEFGKRSRTVGLELLRELLASIPPNNACMEWPRGKNDKYGYARIKIRYKSILVHRLAYEMTRGPIPNGLLVCHKCDNPPCFRPDHLFVGTNADNAADSVAKGRRGKSKLT